MDYIEAAMRMLGRTGSSQGARHVTNAHAVTGTAVGDSEVGTVLVDLGGDVTSGDGSQYVEVQTDAHVVEGDTVDVLLVGESGHGMSPVVYGVPGGGDRMAAAVQDAHDLAASVEGIAQEAAAEVEQVRQDVADFRSDVATTYATKVEREDGDEAVKTWVTTNYTNSNDLATTYATKTLVSQTKDAIELAASQTYETQTDAAATYATKSALTVGLDGIRTEVAEDYQPKGDYATTASMNSAIQQSASSIESSVEATYLKQSDASTTYATKTEVTQTASALDTRITTAQSTADGAASTASTAAGNAATALSTANDALADSVEYIVGTQTAATNAWTGRTRDAALVAGKTIAYKLPYAGNSSAATLNLTLSGGGTTGAKGVRRMADNNANYTVTTQYGAGAVVQMTYDGEYWRVSSGYNPTTDINNARYRTQLPNTIKAAVAYTGGHLICGTSEGYRNIGAGVAFDLGHPLLYATANVAAGATGTGNYLEFENRNASTNGTIQSGAANKTLYLKGTVSGNTFTIAASPFMTTVVPTSEDGFCYIPLGLMYSATNIYFQSSDQLYAYTEGSFQPIGRGALATAQAEVTERQTLIRQFSGGVLAGYVGNAIAALVNAAGSFDVVRTAWTDGVPSILSTLATFGANLIRIGEETGQNVLITSAGQFFRDGLNNLLSLTTGATYTETFQIRADEDYYYELTYRPMAVESVTIDGTATSDYTWTNSGHVVGSGKLGTLVLGYDTWYANPGATLSVTYRTSPAMTVWDGLGNLAANVMSYFTADEIGLGGNIFSDPHGTSRGAAVRFFGATDEQGASLTSGIQRDSGTDYISYVDTIGLTGTTTDEGAALSNGCISDYGITASGYIYDDSESSNDYRAESTANLYARSRSSDAYDAADATARLGVKTVTVGDSGEQSYVTLGDGTGEDTEVPMAQAIAALTTPLYSNSSNVAITTANTDISGPSVTVPAGTYIIVVAYSFPAASGSGTRVTTIGYKPASGAAQYNTFVQASRAAVRLSMFNIVHITAQTSFTAYVRSDHTSGSNGLYIGMTRIS